MQRLVGEVELELREPNVKGGHATDPVSFAHHQGEREVEVVVDAAGRPSGSAAMLEGDVEAVDRGEDTVSAHAIMMVMIEGGEVLGHGDEQRFLSLVEVDEAPVALDCLGVMLVPGLDYSVQERLLEQHLGWVHAHASTSWGGSAGSMCARASAARWSRVRCSMRPQNQKHPPVIAQPASPSITQCSPK